MSGSERPSRGSATGSGSGGSGRDPRHAAGGPSADAPSGDTPLGGPPPSTTRGPLAGLADLAAALEDPASRPSTFLRGLALGALVGAAIAGSRLWRRHRRGRRG